MDRSIAGSETSAHLVEEIRRRLQIVHFTVRGLPCECPGVCEPVADQLHAIRVLAEELNTRS
jgi:hypothetical protein